MTNNSDAETNEIQELRKRLVGKWRKVHASECDAKYPDELEFFERAIYRGQKGPEQRFIWWDAGAYEIVRKDQIQIQAANDELVLYTVSISENTLTFADRDGCEFRYRRIG